MTSKSKTMTRQEQKENTRNLILETSKKLFLERGYEKTTMRMIASEAGVATGTAFTHFPDKSSILMATLYTDIHETALQAMATIPSKGNFIDTLAHIVDLLFKQYAKTPELSKLMFKESLFSEGLWAELVSMQFIGFATYVQTLLENAQQKGEINPNSDCSLLAQSLMALYIYSTSMGLRLGTDVNEQNETFRKLLDSLFFGHIITQT